MHPDIAYQHYTEHNVVGSCDKNETLLNISLKSAEVAPENLKASRYQYTTDLIVNVNGILDNV